MHDDPMPKTPKRPRAFNKLAKRMTEQATREDAKNPAAVALGRLGGLKGGKARAKSLTKAQRSKIAKDAAKARWSNRK